MSSEKSPHWLVKVAQSLKADQSIPQDLEIAPDLTDAWMQVSSLCGLSALELAAGVADHYGHEVGDLRQFDASEGSPLPERLCRQLHAVPLWRTQETQCVAVADPRLTPDQHQQLAFASGKSVKLVILPPEDIDTCQTRLFSVSGEISANKVPVIDLNRAVSSGKEQDTVKVVYAMFQAAIERNASDIHIHPFVGGGAIRFRVDGLMRRIATIPAALLQLVSRYLKTHAGLEINPFKAQDGRLRLTYKRREFDVRLSVLPAYDGDRIVCRLLEQGGNFSLRARGFSVVDLQVLQRLCSNDAGVILLTGPTGSGKTSTLYGLLSELNSVETNVITIENPVEYVLPGISQVQVNERQGLSFADTLRSILRQDPDVILVGEIRDAETAQVAAQAALTGHLVLSTLHTNDALGTVPRLIDLGLHPSTLADALLGVISQRLVRRLCEACRQACNSPQGAHEIEFKRLTGEAAPYRAVGCAACDHTGYRGRVPIIEFFESTGEFRRALLAGERNLDTLLATVSATHRPIAESAAAWIVSGVTTPAEAHRVLGLGFWRDLAQRHGKEPGISVTGISMGKRDRLNILLLSKDDVLRGQLEDALGYDVQMAGHEEEAARLIEQEQGTVAMVFDTRVMDSKPEDWLTRLRGKLAWSGLPALFVQYGERTDELSLQLRKFSAPVIDGKGLNSQTLGEAVQLLLQGRAHELASKVPQDTIWDTGTCK